MAVSVGKIVDQVNAKIVEGGQDIINTARLAGSVQALESRYSVANLASLPPAADNTGRFIYVEDIQAYRYSDGTQWTNDYDTTPDTAIIQLWSWGDNFCGALGDGTTVPKCSPVREISSSTDWCQVSVGYTSAAIKTSGELWVWGRGTSVTGDGTEINRCSPVREFCSATDWCQVSASGIKAAIKTSGQLWVWGSSGLYGRIGDGTTVPKCSPVREFCSATDWCLVDVGNQQSAAIKTSGQIWTWGRNICGALGDGTTVCRCSPVRERCSATDWCQVSAGMSMVAIKTSGELWGWGRNLCGALGEGTTVPKCSPVREICSATDWCQVSASQTGVVAIKTSGELWIWGSNDFGQLGDGTTDPKCSPVREFCSATDWCQADTAHSLCAVSAIKTNGQLWSWGRNACGSLGDGTLTDRCSPVREITSATDWIQVSRRSTVHALKTGKGFNEP